MLNRLKCPEGAVKRRKRVGRGPGCHGKTSGRGHKGQKSRSGGNVSIWFEGGQTPIRLRTPKRGFKNPLKVVYDVVNLKDLNRFNEGEQVTPEELKKARLVSGKNPVKVLGDGELERTLVVKAHSFSKTAIKKIEERGGRVEII
ncbi:MAG: 50S ribosomal protein L15 [Deltaproteobacteria bacterium]|jgi:large subunit ribosomal protein L15|nr:MAG: 50S ribosomal protein L15 [Deltaproteobacteria bacterium]